MPAPRPKSKSGLRPALRLFGVGRHRGRATRMRQIVGVLARYGFGELVAESGISFRHPASDPGTRKLGRGPRLVRALEELGPTFIKLGQLVSTRPDILAPDLIAALGELHDHVPGIPAEDAAQVIEEDLKAAPEQLFAEFDRTPFAAASLSQVHRARLKTGEEVAVKVQRPNIEGMIESDLAVLDTLAGIAARRIPQLAPYDPVGLVHEFGRALRRELDFVREGQNCDICRKDFEDDPEVVIPRVFWNMTSRRVLTLEYLPGLKVNDPTVLDQAGIDRKKLAVAGATAYMKMIFVHGFFQADPHPGNLAVLPDGELVIYDYGMFSRITEADRNRIVDFLLAAHDRRADIIVRLVLDSGYAAPKIEEELFQSDVQDLLDRYYGVELGRIRLGPVVQDLLSVMRNYRVRIPAGFNMLMRGLGTIEGLGLLIDPEFNFSVEMQPFIEKEAKQRFGPLAWFRTLRRSRTDLELALHSLPANLRGVLDRIKKGQIELVLDPEEFRRLGSSLERSYSRLSVAIVLAAIIVGSSLMVFAAPTVFRGVVPVIGILGFLATAVLAIWLVIATLRGGRF